MKKDKKKVSGFREFLRFYTRFQIPWWMFVLSAIAGLAFAEISFRIAEITILVNKGELFNHVILAYVGMSLLSILVSIIRNILASIAEYKITLRSRSVLWKKILGLPVKTVDERHPSKLVSGITNDVEQASIAVAMIFSFVASAYGLVKACVILYKYNGTITRYLMVLIPVAILVFWAVGKMQLFVQRRIYESINQMTGFFSEHLSAAKYVKAQTMEQVEIEEGYKAIDARYKADLLNAFIGEVQVAIFSIYNRLSLIVISIFGSQLIRRGAMETTGINSTSTYMDKVNQFTSEALTQYQNIRGAQGALANVNSVFMEADELPDEGEAYVESENKDIVFDHVSFGYGKKEIMHDISFRIPYQKTIGIIGNNGSGKTTLMKLMQGLYQINAGSIRIGDNEIGKTKLSDIRKRFAYVIQNDSLFTGSIRENICYGCAREVSEEEMIRAAKMASAHDFIMSMPEGYDTMLTEAGMNLSGGQRKRLSFARAFLRDCDYFLLDEAGANLDNKSYSQIYRSLMDKMNDKTIIFIAHEMAEILEADYLLVLSQGTVEAFGTHEELMERSATYRDYVARASREGGRSV